MFVISKHLADDLRWVAKGVRGRGGGALMIGLDSQVAVGNESCCQLKSASHSMASETVHNRHAARHSLECRRLGS